MRPWLIFAILVNLCLTGSVSAETEPVLFPEIPALARSRAWQRLLFHGSTFLGAKRGLMDSPQFYLSPTGKTNPEAELRAFLRALRVPSSPRSPDDHAACRFPARTAWVRAHLPRFPFNAPTCPAWENFQATHAYQGASLVFSSFYVEHPSSLFGHTFLALHKKANPAPLLDDALNYGAVPDTSNPFAYAWLGLVGGFPGTFQLMPYYAKVQEYAHSEHRDLWSYRLALSASEMQTLTQVIWEVGNASADYYFLDENCAALMLYLIAAVSPHLDPPERNLQVIPGDALRTLVRSGLVVKVHGTASSLGRFLARYEELSDVDKETFAEWTRHEPTPLAEAEREARLLDTYLDYMDYREKVAANWSAGAWEAPRRALLARRAALRVRSLEMEPQPPAYRAPHRGHDSMRIGAGLGTASGKRFGTLRMRAALHDLLNQPDGYHESLAVGISSLRVDVSETGAFIPRSYDLVNVTSLPRLPLVIQPMAWDFAFGWRRQGDTGETYVRYAPGWNIPWRNTLDVFVLGRAELGLSRLETFLCAAPLLGMRARPSATLTLLAAATRVHRAARKSGYSWENEGNFTLAWAADEQWELRFEARKLAQRVESILTLYHTF